MAQPRCRITVGEGELALSLWAPDLAGLCAEAGRALAGAIAGGLASDLGELPCTTSRLVLVVARDRDTLLREWLSELVALYQVEGAVYPDVRVLAADEHGLRAEIRGRTVRSPSLRPRGGTLRGGHVSACEGGVVSRVTLDIRPIDAKGGLHVGQKPDDAESEDLPPG